MYEKAFTLWMHISLLFTIYIIYSIVSIYQRHPNKQDISITNRRLVGLQAITLNIWSNIYLHSLELDELAVHL